MIKKLIFLLPLFSVLSACAYMAEGEYQDVTIRTTGAQGSYCDIWANNIRYRVYPPETRNLKSGDKDLVLHCYAPGNRYRHVVIEPRISKKTYANVLNGLAPGVAVDYASGAMFAYPRTIDIDFSHIPATDMPLPAHNNNDIMEPEKHFLEEFRPSSPRLNEDRYHRDQPIQRRIRPGSALDTYRDSAYYSAGQISSDSGAFASDMEKGGISRVIQDLGAQDFDPALPQSSTPIMPLLPAENNDGVADEAHSETQIDTGVPSNIDAVRNTLSP